MAKRAIISARVSTDRQRDNYSIPTQIQACVAYAEQKGYTLVGDCFVDRESGLDVPENAESAVAAYVDDYTSLEISRPALNRAFAYLKREGFDVVIVLTIDRLARDPYIRETIERDFEQFGARVEYVQGSYDNTPEGEVRKDLEATFAKWENAKRVERCARGKRRKAEAGLFVCGTAPFGYTLDAKAMGGLSINLGEAEVVKRIFSMYGDDGHSLHSIVSVLNSEGIIPPRGGEKWSKTTVRNILTHGAYAGRMYYNQRRTSRRGAVEFRDPSEWIEIETTPLVDRGLFEFVQERLKHNGQSRRQQAKRFYLLSGMVRCARCGMSFASSTQKAGRHRRINDAQSYRHRVKSGHCSNKVVSARIIEPEVWSRVKGILLDPERLRRGYMAVLEQQQESQGHLRRHLETLRRSRGKAQTKRQNLDKAYVDPDIELSKDDYLAHRSDIKAEIAEIEKQIQAVETQLADAPQIAEWQELEGFVRRIRANLEGNIPETTKRQLYEMLHLVVYLNPETGEIDHLEGWFAIGDDNEDDTGNDQTGNDGEAGIPDKGSRKQAKAHGGSNAHDDGRSSWRR